MAEKARKFCREVVLRKLNEKEESKMKMIVRYDGHEYESIRLNNENFMADFYNRLGASTTFSVTLSDGKSVLILGKDAVQKAAFIFVEDDNDEK